MIQSAPRLAVSKEDNETREALDRVLSADAGIPYVHHSIREMSERNLSARVRKMVNDRPQLWGHTSYDYNHRWGTGWVDWVIIGPGGVLFRELKSPSGHLSDQQRYVGQMLRHHGCNWAIWDPDSLADGTIGRELDTLTAAPTS